MGLDGALAWPAMTLPVFLKKGGAEEGTEKSTFKVVHIKKGTFLFDQTRKKKV